jgi:hypothetical protein
MDVNKQGEVLVLCGDSMLQLPVLPISTRTALDALLNNTTQSTAELTALVSDFVSTIIPQTPVVVRELDFDSKSARDSIVIDRANGVFGRNGQTISLGAE